MSGGKAAERSNSGATAKKTTFSDETTKFTNTSSAYTTDFLNSSLHPTKMECCAMIIIDKDPNKGLLFESNTGSNLGHPVGFFFCPEFLPAEIQPHDTGLQIHRHDDSITQWVFSF